MTRIVTTTYRYKRPPRKRKAVALEVPAIITRKRAERSSHPSTSTSGVPANGDRKSAIASATSRKRRKLLRAEARSSERDDDPEAAAQNRTWLERAKWGHGPSR
jgi:hypothetical protein